MSIANNATFCSLDGLVIDHLAGFLDIMSVYNLVCANSSVEDSTITPSWFIRYSLKEQHLGSNFTVQFMDEEHFYLASIMPQYRKCHLIPTCIYNDSYTEFDINNNQLAAIAKFLRVDATSIYAKQILRLMWRIMRLARTAASQMSSVKLLDMIMAAQVFGFRNLPEHDTIYDLQFLERVMDQHGLAFSTMYDVFSILYAPHPVGCHLGQHDAGFRKMLFHVTNNLEDDNKSVWYLERHEIMLEENQQTISLLDGDDEQDVQEWLDTFDQNIVDPLFVDRQAVQSLIQSDEEMTKQFIFMLAFEAQPLGTETTRTLRLDHDCFCQLCYSIFGKECNFVSPSAIVFLQRLVEEVHFGHVIESKIRIQHGDDDLGSVEWEYRLLFCPNGTVLPTLRLPDGEETQDDDDGEDEDYVPDDDDDDFMDVELL